MKDKIKTYYKDIINTPIKKITVMAFFIAPLVVNIIIEMLNKRSVFKALGCLVTEFPTYLINYLIILFTMSFTLFMRKRLVGIVALSAVWLGLGIANFILKSFRETPFSFNDIRLAGSVFTIVDKYLNPLTLILLVVLIVLVVLSVIALYIKAPIYSTKLNYARNAVFVAVVFGVMMLSVLLGNAFGFVSEKFPNMSIAYEEYGFVYCFANSVVNVGVEKPEEYSKEALKEIVDRIQNETTVDDSMTKTPNIIFLQLESFFDINRMTSITLSEDPIPTFNKLKKEYPSGFLTVNNVGYGTANTEFEIMTGMNLEDFGPGEFPYKTVLRERTCESTSFILRDYGYITHAMHNNTGTFYSRHKVFKNLGYDTFTSVEYMNPTEYTPYDWVKDKILTDEILKVLDSTDEVDYLYTISVQGHGTYPTENILENPKIKVTGLEDIDRAMQIQYYVNQLNEMDEFIKELTDKLMAYNEDVVLVMFGDHLPSLAITEDELVNGDLYQTEYIIWSNFGLELENKDIETFQLSSRVLEALNIDGGVINKFHQIYNDEENYLEALKSLEYDILYGDLYVFGGQSPYIATDMMMGTYEVTIDDVVEDNGEFDKDVDSDNADENNGDVNKGSVDDDINIDSDKEESDKVDEDNNSVGDNDNEGDLGNEEDSTDASDNETENETETPSSEEDDNPYENYYIVVGNYFSMFSKVFINNEGYETEFIDDKHLRVYVEDLNNLDTFSVRQMDGSKALSKSNDFIFISVTK